MTKLDKRSSYKLKIKMYGILNSTMVSAVGYDLATKTLRVKFKRNKSVYDYRRVSSDVFAQLMGFDSTGLGMHANILSKYDCVLVSKPKEITVKEIVEKMKEEENERIFVN